MRLITFSAHFQSNVCPCWNNPPGSLLDPKKWALGARSAGGEVCSRRSDSQFNFKVGEGARRSDEEVCPRCSDLELNFEVGDRSSERKFTFGARIRL